MPFAYKEKVVISGDYAEYYSYKKKIWKDYDKKKIKRIPKQLSLLDYKKNKLKQQKFSINRARTKLRRLINCNTNLDKFLTLTYSANFKDLKQSNYNFNQFIKRLSYYFPNLAYVCVPEFQKRGAVHYHLLCDIPYIHFSRITELWGHGNIDIQKVKNVDNIGAYVAKYLSKDGQDERFFGKKRFFCSQNLKTPIELFLRSAFFFFQDYLVSLLPIIDISFTSSWCGKVVYKVFKLKENPFKNGLYRPFLFSP